MRDTDTLPTRAPMRPRRGRTLDARRDHRARRTARQATAWTTGADHG